MRISDIGIKQVFCATPDNNLYDIAVMMKFHDVGVIPVCEGTKLVGVITDRDIVTCCVAGGNEATKCRAKEIMSFNPVTVNPDTDLEEAARLMGKEQVHRLPVIENGRLVGLVSLGDISIAIMKNDSLVADTLRKISMPKQVVSVC